jgi:hypothetical protein
LAFAHAIITLRPAAPLRVDAAPLGPEPNHAPETTNPRTL